MEDGEVRIFGSADIEVTDSKSAITIRRSPVFHLLLGGGSIAVAMLFRLIPAEMFAFDPVLVKVLLKVFSSILILLGVMIILIYILLPDRNSMTIDKMRGAITGGGLAVPFAAVTGITLKSLKIQNVTSLSIVALADGKEFFLVPGQLEGHREKMEELTALLRECVLKSRPGERPEPVETEPSKCLPAENLFLGLTFLVSGSLFSLFTYLYAPHVIFIAHGAGVLLWPVGLWICGIGITEILRIPLWKAMTNGTAMQKILFHVLLTASYILICAVH